MSFRHVPGRNPVDILSHIVHTITDLIQHYLAGEIIDIHRMVVDHDLKFIGGIKSLQDIRPFPRDRRLLRIFRDGIIDILNLIGL